MENKITKHSLSLLNRKNLNMEGIKEVISFNENTIVLETTQGNLNIEGSELNIQHLNLDSSNIKITGHISVLEYNDKLNKKGLLNRLFK